jgi:hypothetical protein
VSKAWRHFTGGNNKRESGQVVVTITDTERDKDMCQGSQKRFVESCFTFVDYLPWNLCLIVVYFCTNKSLNALCKKGRISAIVNNQRQKCKDWICSSAGLLAIAVYIYMMKMKWERNFVRMKELFQISGKSSSFTTKVLEIA